MSCNSTDRKLAIVGIVQVLGTASVAEVIAKMGLTRGESTDAVRKTIYRLVANDILLRVGRGLYMASPRASRRCLSVVQCTEQAILRYLREVGGVARTGDIHSAVFLRQKLREERPYEHVLVTRALKNSELFSQKYGRGYWNLDEEECERLPLAGMWAAKEIELAWLDGDPTGDWASCDDERDALFECVGVAFAEARGVLDIAAVVQNVAVKSALDEMMRIAPAVRGLALEELYADFVAERTDAEARNAVELDRLFQREKRRVYEYIYALFEAGNLRTHLSAPAALYLACGQLYSVCPAALSRGKVFGREDEGATAGAGTAQEATPQA